MPKPLSIDAIAEQLASYKPRRLPGRQWVARCGVVLLMAEHDRRGRPIPPVLLMMQRAQRTGDPWSGHVAFPGGRVDPSDASTRAAALRELTEETGFDASLGLDPVGRLSDRLTREHGRARPMVVSPYVYRTRRSIALQPGVEAAALWWVPLSNLQAPERRSTLIWRVAGLPITLPCVDLDKARLWGLSLMMTDELLHVVGLTGTPIPTHW
jgi:8-oxo-dGTP pyrophosphatase MutT (NUDIX family)